LVHHSEGRKEPEAPLLHFALDIAPKVFPRLGSGITRRHPTQEARHIFYTLRVDFIDRIEYYGFFLRCRDDSRGSRGCVEIGKGAERLSRRLIFECCSEDFVKSERNGISRER
jgi:hypothetical protein